MAMAKRSTKIKRQPGRPPEDVPAKVADEIIAAIAAGQTLRSWCEEKESRPCFATVYKWMAKDEGFRRRMSEARTTGFDAIAEEMLVESMRRPEDQLDLNWKKLRVDTVLRLLSKWDPSRYGDRQQVDHGGGVSINVITGVPKREQADS